MADSIVEVFSQSSNSWCVGLVASSQGNRLVVRFLDTNGAPRQKVVAPSDATLGRFGEHTSGDLPPSFLAVPSNSRPGQYSFFDPVAKRKVGTVELAWKVYLEQHLVDDPVEAANVMPDHSGTVQFHANRNGNNNHGFGQSRPSDRPTRSSSQGRQTQLGLVMTSPASWEPLNPAASVSQQPRPENTPVPLMWEVPALAQHGSTHQLAAAQTQSSEAHAREPRSQMLEPVATELNSRAPPRADTQSQLRNTASLGSTPPRAQTEQTSQQAARLQLRTSSSGPRRSSVDEWVATYMHMPVESTPGLVYFKRIPVNFTLFVELLMPVAYVNQDHRLRIIKEVESGAVMDTSLDLFTRSHVDMDGNLHWHDCGITNFVTWVFHAHNIGGPTEDLIQPVFDALDVHKNGYLSVWESLCLVDALMRATFMKEFVMPDPQPGE